MNPQIKDHFYDQFLKEPTKDNFRDFMKKSCGELNEMDFMLALEYELYREKKREPTQEPG